VHGGSLTVGLCVLRDLAPVAFDRSSGREPVRKSSPKGCSRLARPPRTSQAAVEMKREHNWGLEKRIRAKR
jgi:hypothetical protein